MKSTIITRKKGVKTRNPILLVGLPGIGSVGRIVVEHMKKELKAEKIATLYSPHFPNHAIMGENGRIRMVSNRFYLARSKSGVDAVLLTGDSQAASPEGQFEVNMRIVRFFRDELKGKRIITLGGYIQHEGRPGKPRVFGNGTNSSIIEEFKKEGVLFSHAKGVIWGSAGMLVAFAKLNKIEGICLMGETSFDFDAMAAKAVLDILSKKLKLRLNTENIDKLVKETAQAMSELENQIKSSTALYGEGGENTEGKISYIR